jgi:hypothetical protein
VLDEPRAVPGAPAPSGAVEEEAERLVNLFAEALASGRRAEPRTARARARSDGCAAHGMRTRPARSRRRSNATEMTRIPTMPVRISV